MSDLRVPDLNTVTIAGRLTRDPELKYVAGGRAVCEFSLANTQFYKGKDGERKENTTFVNGTCWDKQAEWVGEKMKKGRPVIVEGKLKSDTWDDKTTGQKRSKITITANRVTPLDWDGEKGDGGQHSEAKPTQGRADLDEPIPDSDIPF